MRSLKALGMHGSFQARRQTDEMSFLHCDNMPCSLNVRGSGSRPAHFTDSPATQTLCWDETTAPPAPHRAALHPPHRIALHCTPRTASRCSHQVDKTSPLL